MCGIAGIVGKDLHLDDRMKVSAAIHCLQHRGPDSVGIWKSKDNDVIVGHRRLSIIDLSSAASQPMQYMGRYTIIHNGEIYNYIELKHELQHKGYQFHSESDTEVIAAAYDAWRDAAVQKFDGMFACAIWDEKEKTAFIARDRMGEKPLFFFYDKNQLLFASELKALWEMGAPKEVNRSMLYNFLTIGYTSNPGEPQETFYNNLHKLPAASFLRFQLNSEPEVNRYWHVDPEIKKPIGTGEALEQFRELFTDSIKKRLRSDVPVGTSLSGGLDSSSIIAFCEKYGGDRYSHTCFTASFPGYEKDESSYADLVAEKFNLTVNHVSVDEDQVVSLMDRVMQNQQEPISSGSALAQFRVYEKAAQSGIKVLLDGQGADELLGGYHKYFKWYWQELFRAKRSEASREISAAERNGITEKFTLKNKLAAVMPQFSSAVWQGLKTRSAFRHSDLDRKFAFENKASFYHVMPASFDLDGALYFDSFVIGLEELLRLADRNSMAHGAEVRLPFLSHQLVEFLFTLPSEMKIRNGWTKWLLRETVKGQLPEEITWRKDKIGFQPPQKKWMQQPDVKEAISQSKKILADEGILNRKAIQKIQPHESYAAENMDWKYWSASFMFRPS
ncbi:MAG: asparagine synthase (glutamine-hydrolyzing) [Flavisolibacter sp.]